VAAKGAGLTNYTVVPTALGRTPGVVDLHAGDADTLTKVGMRSIYGSGEVIDSVPVTSFDGWAEAAGLTRLDVVKIDVDGSELDVLIGMLIGMQRSLRSLRPRLVIIEVIEENLRRGGSSAAELLELMADCGYVVAGETERDVLFRPTGSDGLESPAPAADH
jgi:FkbM family methyltransferase